MTFVEFNDLAESLAEYIDDLKLTRSGDVEALECKNTIENWTNLKDWLYEVYGDSDCNVKITYENNQIKLTLS